MKKRLLAGLLAGAMILTGCAGSTGLETDELKISQYKGVEIAEVERLEAVTDEQVEAEIQAVLESNVVVTEVTDRAVQDGDTVDIDFVGKVDGEVFDGGSAEHFSLVIGSGAFIDGFEDSVIGHNIGDTYDWNGKFPEEYRPELAGKDCVFTITVNAISVETVPELNDEFVKTVSETATTVEEYKEEIKTELERYAELYYQYTLMGTAWIKVIENTEVLEWPESVEEEFNRVVETYEASAKASGMEYKEFIELNMGTTVEEFEAYMREQIEGAQKEKLVSEAIAKKERIRLTDKKYEEQLELIAEMNGYADVEMLKADATEDELKEIALGLLVMEFVADNCIQVAE